MPAIAPPLWESWPVLEPRLAQGTLLAAFDFDGTLVPIKPTPEEAIADEGTRTTLTRLAASPGTSVAVVSGRPVAWLRDLLPAEELWLVGLHGLEIAAPHGEVLPTIDLEAASAALEPLRYAAAEIAARREGVRIEDKGATLVLHTRQASRREAIGAADEMRRVAEGIPGFEVMGGKEVVEARPAGTGKGTAMLRLLREAGGETVLYVGDDTTDEDAFAALEEAASGNAVTVRVGGESDPPTRARFTIASQRDVAELLRRLVELRRR